MQLSSLWDWVVSLNINVLSPSIFLKILWFHFLKLNSILFSICTRFYYLFIYWWTTRLVPIPFYSKEICSKHEVQISLWQAQRSLGTCPGVKYCGHMVVPFLIFWGASKTDSCHGHSNLQTPATVIPVFQHPLQHLLLDFLIAVMTGWVPPHSKIMFTEIQNHRFVLECWSHSIYSDHP